MSKSMPYLKLSDEDGNAFFLLGRCRQAAKSAGWTREQIEEFMEKALDGDYNHLLRTVSEHFEVD